MKKIITLSLLSCVVLLAATQDKKIEKIKEDRVGIEKEKLQDCKEPFALIKTKELKSVMVVPAVIQEEVTTFKLNALMNKTAFLNGSWHKEGDVIDGYQLKYIGKKGVVLRKGNEIKKVYLQKRSSKNLKIEIN